MNRRFVIQTLAEAADSDATRIDLETSTTELGLDSFALFWFISQVEAASGAELSPEQVMQLFQAQSVADVVSAVRCAAEKS